MTLRRFFPTHPVEVVAHRTGGEPLAMRWRGRNERVVAIEEMWDLEEGWWRSSSEATRRRYYRLRVNGGKLCVVYRDLGSGRWYLEQISD